MNENINFDGETEIPPVLYKYISLKDHQRFLPKLLSGESLKFSSPTTFNDPFECLPAIHIEKGRRGWAHIENLYNRYPGSSKKSESLKKQLKSIRNNPLTQSGEKIGLKDIMNRIGICSLSETYNSILMWSHYADKHTGLCIGFDTSEIFFKPAWKVLYQDEYPTIDKLNDSPEQSIQKGLLTKSKHWEYEKEWRLIMRTVSEEEKHRIKIAHHGDEFLDLLLSQNGPGNYSFPKNSITELIFGLNIEPTARDDALRLQKLHNLSCKTFQMKKGEFKYELNKKEITPRFVKSRKNNRV